MTLGHWGAKSTEEIEIIILSWPPQGPSQTTAAPYFSDFLDRDLHYLRPHPVRHDASEAGCPCEAGETRC